MAAHSTDYTVTVHHEDGSFWAEVDQMPGCFAAGDTEEEMWECLREAMSLYLSTPESGLSVKFSAREVVSESVEASVLVS